MKSIFIAFDVIKDSRGSCLKNVVPIYCSDKKIKLFNASNDNKFEVKFISKDIFLNYAVSVLFN